MNKLIRLKNYENAIEANRDKQLLTENDINSFIANEQTIQSDWLLSQAIGGIQLQVFESDLEKAKEILINQTNEPKEELEVEFTISNPEFDFVCPKCGSNHIYQEEKPAGVFVVLWLLTGIPLLYKKSTYHCYYCNNTFKH